MDSDLKDGYCGCCGELRTFIFNPNGLYQCLVCKCELDEEDFEVE